MSGERPTKPLPPETLEAAAKEWERSWASQHKVRLLADEDLFDTALANLWWDHATRCENWEWCPSSCHALLRKDPDEMVEISLLDYELFMVWASKLPGWESGDPEHPHPVRRI